MMIKIIRFIVATVLFMFVLLIFMFTILPSFTTKTYEQQKTVPPPISHNYAGCYVSDKLRIQIGDTIFKLPRRNISNTKGPDVQWEGEPTHSRTLDGGDVCQREHDPPLIYDQIGYTFRPKKCSEIAMQDSLCSRFSGRLYALENFDLSQQERRKKNVEKCKTDSYFRLCMHDVIYKNTGYYFQYYERKYPLDDIENTEQMIIDYFKARDITETVKDDVEQTSTIEKSAP